MRRTMQTIGAAAIALTALTACGGDDALDVPGGLTTQPAAGGDVGDTGGVAGDDTSQECLEFAMEYAAAIGSMGGTTEGDGTDWEAWIATMQASVPDELKEAVSVWGRAMDDYMTVVEQYADNPSAPEVMTALQALGTPEVLAASEQISAYFDNGCPS